MHNIWAKEKKQVNNVAFIILLSLIWAKDTIFSYVVEVIERLPLVGVFSEYVFDSALIIAIVFSFPYLSRKVKMQDILIYIIGLFVVLCSLLFQPNTLPYFKYETYIIFPASLYLFFGVAFNLKDYKDLLFWLSFLGVCAVFLYQFYYMLTGRELIDDNMGTAYAVLLSVVYLIYYAFLKKDLRYWITAIIGIILSFLFGTRGVILCVGVFLIIGFYLTIFRNFKKNTKTVVIVTLVLMAALLLFTDLTIEIAKILSSIFKDLGFSTRIFDWFIEGNIAADNGRNELIDAVMAALLKKPVFGYGILGDRVVLEGRYVHNIMLELWCDFGFILGSACLLFFISLFCRFVFKTNVLDEKLFILMLLSIVVPKLIVSGSYIREPWFFFLIGFGISTLRNNKIRIRRIGFINENN